MGFMSPDEQDWYYEYKENKEKFDVLIKIINSKINYFKKKEKEYKKNKEVLFGAIINSIVLYEFEKMLKEFNESI